MRRAFKVCRILNTFSIESEKLHYFIKINFLDIVLPPA